MKCLKSLLKTPFKIRRIPRFHALSNVQMRFFGLKKEPGYSTGNRFLSAAFWRFLGITPFNIQFIYLCKSRPITCNNFNLQMNWKLKDHIPYNRQNVASKKWSPHAHSTRDKYRVKRVNMTNCRKRSKKVQGLRGDS